MKNKITFLCCFLLAAATQKSFAQCVPPGAISGPSVVCPGSSINLTDATSGGTWSSSSTPIATVNSLTGVVTGVGVGTVTITYATGPGCRAVFIVTVPGLPLAITGSSSLCVGSNTTLSDGTPGGTWSSSDASIASVVSGTGVVTGNAGGTATITYTTSGGCIATYNMIVVAAPTATAISGTNPICQGSTESWTVTGTPGGSWTSTHFTSGLTGNPWATVTSTGASTADVHGAFGPSSCAKITYTISNMCGTASVNRIATIKGAPSVTGSPWTCVGDTKTVVPVPASGSGSWTTVTSAVTVLGSSFTGVSPAGLGAAIYTHTFTATSDYCAATVAKSVGVVAQPNLVLSGGGGTIYNSGSCGLHTVTINVSGTSGIVSHIWDDDGLVTLTSSTYHSAVYTGSGSVGTATITYSALGSYCVNSVSVTTTVYVDDCGEGKRVTPSASGSTVANAEGITIYPNPSKGTFTVGLPVAKGGCVINITNLAGRQLTTKTTSESTASFDLSGYPAGIYFISVQAGDIRRTEELIVE